MDQIELRHDRLALGMSLGYTLRDQTGLVLLAKGQRIETASQLEGIRSRGKIFVEIDESEEGLRIMMSGIATLNQLGAPLKDFSKHMNLNQNSGAEGKLSGTLVQRWGDLESKLGGVLASVLTTADFGKKIEALAQHVHQQMTDERAASQFLLFNRAVSHFNDYSVLHALLCAALVHSLAEGFALSMSEQRSLVCAALTMNVGMTHLQNQLALQKTDLTAHQRGVIEQHPEAGRQALREAGVTDPVWLDMVALHHSPLTGPEALADWAPVPRMTKILQTVDRYTAAMSPRKSRVGRTARDSVRSVVLQTGSARHDEVGTALVRILGLSPPGTYVKLANGETAVVIRRGLKPGEPLVASVLNRHDDPIGEPRLHDTAREGWAIQSTLSAASVRIHLNMEAMLRLIKK
jgi:hypothetical protein